MQFATCITAGLSAECSKTKFSYANLYIMQVLQLKTIHKIKDLKNVKSRLFVCHQET